MSMHKIKTGDKVILLAGRDKGREGKVLRFAAKNRVYVEGVNMVKKHVKANPQINEAGGIREQEAPLQISNVALVNPRTGKADRVGIKVLDDNTKVRYFKSDNEVIDA